MNASISARSMTPNGAAMSAKSAWSAKPWTNRSTSDRSVMPQGAAMSAALHPAMQSLAQKTASPSRTMRLMSPPRLTM